jgi:uncharacterized protein YndB with AHSA1/START domain
MATNNELHNIATSADNDNGLIVTSRIINVPVTNVYEAWTNPEILARWWGPNGFTNTFEKYELVPGGEWVFVMHGPDGTDYPNKSIFVEILENQKLVFDHVSGHRFRVMATFVEAGNNKTLLTFRMLFEDIAEYEKIKSFVIEANEQNFDKLEAILNSN